MMKILIISVILFFLVLSFSQAQIIDVNIKKVVDIEMNGIDFNSTIKNGKPFKINTEFYNTGSVDYKARVRLNILDEDKLIFTGWAAEKYFFPGNRKIYELYWYPLNTKKNLQAVVMVYYANETKKVKTIKFEVEPSKETPENIFKIVNFRTYEDEVEFLLKTNETVKNVIIVPSSYPVDWIFEQVKMDELKSGSVNLIKLKYQPSEWEEINVTINIFSEDGKYYTNQSFIMKRETALWHSIYTMVNNLRAFLGI